MYPTSLKGWPFVVASQRGSGTLEDHGGEHGRGEEVQNRQFAASYDLYFEPRVHNIYIRLAFLLGLGDHKTEGRQSLRHYLLVETARGGPCARGGAGENKRNGLGGNSTQHQQQNKICSTWKEGNNAYEPTHAAGP
jgi:hypothetical protein